MQLICNCTHSLVEPRLGLLEALVVSAFSGLRESFGASYKKSHHQATGPRLELKTFSMLFKNLLEVWVYSLRAFGHSHSSP
jgi:hypothetical protein